MKRILILALGSRGDVQPYITLGQALHQAGHTVRVATFELFGDMVRAGRLEFLPIHGDAEGLLRTASQAGMLSGGGALRMAAALHRSYGSLAASLPNDLSGPALRGTELVLNQLPAYLFGWDIAEYLGIPHAIVSVIPLARSRYQPLLGFPQALRFLPGYNLLTARLGEQIGWQMFRGAVNSWRAGVGLAPQPFWGSYERIQRECIPVINGFSEQVVPRPPDWGAHIHMTGWWKPEDLEPDAALPGWSPPADLLRFLDAGSPPVFIGFGSMPVRDSDRVTAMIIEAARIAGQRVVLHAGWAGLGGHLPESVYPVQYLPYGWLFPRMAAVIHHGGSGTTGYALASGVPSFVVPFAFDQGMWGSHGARLGVGPAPLPFRSMTAERLAGRMQESLSNESYRQNAAALAETLRGERGVWRAVEIVNRL